MFLLCGCACLSFSDILDYGYVVMLLNVLRSDITIKKSTWYQSHPERSHCAAETVLRQQLLKIRVSCLKNPKILKLVVLVDSLYLEIGEGSGAKTFTS